MHKVVDLRSDTVTRPTPEMRQAMACAEVGDDVFGDDPTVNRLQEMAAERMHKESALFFPSGTMANETAIKVWTHPGQEILAEEQSHILTAEAGGPAALSGVITRGLPGPGGVIPPELVARNLSKGSEHRPKTALLCLENTHNYAGGTVLPLEVMKEYYTLCRSFGVPIHLDGARIFNAQVATGIPAWRWAELADSVMFSLSKGLCAPVGSLLCGTKDFIREAHQVRKLFGGGMRQVGILAAAGIVALEKMIDRLSEDHKKAQYLAQGLLEVPGVEIDLASVQTNMVYLTLKEGLPGAYEVVNRLKHYRILCLAIAPRRIRLVTHYDVDFEDVNRAVEAFHQVLKAG